MENEGELGKKRARHTDQGYSEEKTDQQVDLGTSSKTVMKHGNIFASRKKGKTLFQAQKKEEI